MVTRVKSLETKKRVDGFDRKKKQSELKQDDQYKWATSQESLTSPWRFSTQFEVRNFRQTYTKELIANIFKISL